MAAQKILIALPSGDRVHKGFLISLSHLLFDAFMARIDVYLADARSTAIEDNRNLCVQSALNVDATHIFWVDSDMTFPADAMRLLIERQKDIVGASYRKRGPPYARAHAELDEVLGGEDEFRQVKRLPGGLLLVRTPVYAALSKPWYRCHYTEGSNDKVSADFTFCDRAREAGYEIWLDEALSRFVGHLGEQCIGYQE